MSAADLLALLPNPDYVGESEYRALHELIFDVLDATDAEDVRPDVLSMLDNMAGWAVNLRAALVGEPAP